MSQGSSPPIPLQDQGGTFAYDPIAQEASDRIFAERAQEEEVQKLLVHHPAAPYLEEPKIYRRDSEIHQLEEQKGGLLKRRKIDFSSSPSSFPGALLPEPSRVWKTYPESQIFVSQHNIACKLIEQFIHLKIIDPNCTENLHLNLIFIGPTFTSLRDQTSRRVMEVFNFPDISGVKLLLEKDRFINSSSLFKTHTDKVLHEGAKSFLSKFENPSYIHLIVHDEGHWGIKTDSLINKFLLEVEKKKNQLQAINPKLMLLGVSATPYAFDMEGLDLIRVSWPDLKESDPAHFATEGYLSNKDLRLVVDLGIPKELPEAKKSSLVLQEYETAVYHLLHHSPSPPQTIAFTILTDLISSDGPMLAVVRLSQRHHALELKAAFMPLLFPKSDILIITLLGDSGETGTLRAQVKGQNQDFSDSDGSADISLELLGDRKVLLIVVDRLSIGETLPKTLRHYDIRGKYGLETPKATLVQDVGRCAGYGKSDAPATVYSTLEDALVPQDRKPDGILKKNAQPTTLHPEHENNNNGQIYTQLSKNTVLLCAEPQIGKTGVIAAFLILVQALLDPKNEFRSNLRNPAESHFVQMNKDWARMANEDHPKFLQDFPGIFPTYHLLYENARRSWGPQEPYAQVISELKSDVRDSLKVADCGCGMGGLYHTLTADQDLSISFDYYGFDISDAIQNIKATSSAKFYPVVGDMAPERLECRFHFVIYCLSLFEKAILRHLKWATGHLENEKGKIIIVDLTRRFPETFKKMLQDLGFCNPRVMLSDCKRFSTWIFNPPRSMKLNSSEIGLLDN